jgi:hypothetical protein
LMMMNTTTTTTMWCNCFEWVLEWDSVLGLCRELMHLFF